MAIAGAGTTANGASIVEFELAGAGQSHRIMDEWGASGRAAAARSLWVDYLWIVTYVAALGFACRYLAARALRRGWEGAALSAYLIGGAVVLAGLLDAIENTFLLLQLGDVECDCTRNAAVARSAALGKFALVAVVLTWVVVVGLALWAGRGGEGVGSPGPSDDVA